MKIRYLDISELNERIDELIALRDALKDANDAFSEAEDELAAWEAKVEADPQNTGLRLALEVAETTVAEAQDAVERAEIDFGTDEEAELGRLESLRDEIGSVGDHISEDNGPFVREDDFEEYARELAEDIGAIDRNASWPNDHIDWAAAADALKMDYSSVEWDGDTYLYRC